MDEWIALLAQKIYVESTQDIVNQIYIMKLGVTWERFHTKPEVTCPFVEVT